MALPNPNQYQEWTRKEAIGTHTSAALLQMQMNMLMKSPLLRMIPGSGILKERSEFKKRELYERTGRDETGRKLTKQEFEERAKRRKDLGALGDIRDLLDKWKDEGVPVYMVDAPSKKLGGGKQKVVGSSGGGAYALADEETKAEAERAQQEEDDRIEKKQETFFTKLFGGKKEGGGKEGGLLGALMGLLSPILDFFKDIFKGGLSGLVNSVLSPILGAIGGAIGSIAGALTPLLMAMAPALLPFLAAGGLAWLVKGKIEDETQAMDEASKREGMRGVQMKNVGGVEVPVETINGKETGRLHTGFATPAQAAAFKKAKNGVNPVLPKSTLTPEKKQLKTDLERLDGMMDAFTQDLRNRAGDLDNPGTGEQLASQWNAVKKYAESMMDRSSANGLGDQASEYLSKLCASYGPFERMFSGGSFVGGDARYVVTGGLDKNQLILPTGWLDLSRTSTTSAGLPFLRVFSPSEAMTSETDIGDILRASNRPGISQAISENAALQSMPSGGGSLTVAPTNVQTNSTVNTMGAVSAPRTGADTGFQFSGFHLVPGLR